MNFFKATITENVCAREFGLCDNENIEDEDGNMCPKYSGKPMRAFVLSSAEKNDWIASVENPDSLPLSFVPVDKGVLADDEPSWIGRGRCDGMLYDCSHMFFVELKDQKEDWMRHAICQLRDTIELFIKIHGRQRLDSIPRENRKAYACNKRHPSFCHSHRDDKDMFRDCLGVRLFIEATIQV